MCDTIVVVSDDRVLLAKNSDRDPNEAQALEWHARASHPAGAPLRCTWIDIPQVAGTNAILISRPFWMWGAEMGANEHGVVIGNEAVFTKEPYLKVGLTGMDMLRIALERASSAEEAVSVMTSLLDAHGQGGGCGHERRSFTYHNSFAIADPGEAWVLETAGRHWATERVRAGVRTISNGLTIPGFAERYSDRIRTAVSACRARRSLTARAAGRKGAAGPTAADLTAVLRSHGAHALPRYSPVNGAMAAPCMHAGGVLAASQTTASWVSELAAGNAVHWATATAAPCTSLFKPFSIDLPVDLGPAPDDRFDPLALWWRHELLHRAALRDPARAFPKFTPQRDAVEQAWLADPPPTAEAVSEAGGLLDRWTMAVREDPGEDTRPLIARRYWRTRDFRSRISEVDRPRLAGAL
jgi:secernin